MAVTDINQKKDSEIADLKRTIEVCKRQNQNVHRKLLERDALIQELSKKCLLFDKITRHKDSLQQIVKIINSLNPHGSQGAGDVTNSATSKPPSGQINNLPSGGHIVNSPPGGQITNHLNTTPDGADADESDQSSDGEGAGDSSPPAPASIKELTESFSRSNIRHFSISEDDSADDRDSVFRKMKREKELYL